MCRDYLLKQLVYGWQDLLGRLEKLAGQLQNRFMSETGVEHAEALYKLHGVFEVLHCQKELLADLLETVDDDPPRSRSSFCEMLQNKVKLGKELIDEGGHPVLRAMKSDFEKMNKAVVELQQNHCMSQNQRKQLRDTLDGYDSLVSIIDKILEEDETIRELGEISRLWSIYRDGPLENPYWARGPIIDRDLDAESVEREGIRTEIWPQLSGKLQTLVEESGIEKYPWLSEETAREIGYLLLYDKRPAAEQHLQPRGDIFKLLSMELRDPVDGAKVERHRQALLPLGYYGPKPSPKIWDIDLPTMMSHREYLRLQMLQETTKK